MADRKPWDFNMGQRVKVRPGSRTGSDARTGTVAYLRGRYVYVRLDICPGIPAKYLPGEIMPLQESPNAR